MGNKLSNCAFYEHFQHGSWSPAQRGKEPAASVRMMNVNVNAGVISKLTYDKIGKWNSTL